MGRKSVSISAVVVCLLAGVAAYVWHSRSASDCQPPPNEDALLAAFRAEPVFRFVPPYATLQGSPTSERGCQRLTEKVTVRGKEQDAYVGDTSTKVAATFDLGVSFGQDQITAMYDAGLRGRGWMPQQADFPQVIPGDYQAGLFYCKNIDGVPSFLWIDERWIGPSQGTAPRGGAAPSPTSPFDREGTISISIHAQSGVGCLPSPTESSVDPVASPPS
ncbi:hypothetical protein GCM10023322_73440 [Rugosimonospora acidiphila]|uniref:Uncharacterized protein n=1 Tax=Rugosimonospora acidiphila TaxID=556531 RepID=A0ABP9SQN6_9ACTN